MLWKSGQSILVREPVGKRLLGRSRRRCDGSIEMYLHGMGWEDVVWKDVAQDREKIAHCCAHGNEETIWAP
jgi:hypothetical protein